MKKKRYLILLFSCFRLVAQIPNQDFEESIYNRDGLHWNGYYEFHSQIQSPHSGTYGVSIHFYRDAQNILHNVPLHTGTFANHFVPNTVRPSKFSGWFNLYENQDTALFRIEFKKSGLIIGSGQYTATGIYLDYTRFSVDINYSSAEIPDSISISLGFKTKINEYARMLVDDLSLDQIVGVNMNEELPNNIDLFPNPANEFVELNFTSLELIDEFQSYAIYNHLGLLVREGEILVEKLSCRITLDDLPSGVYSLQLNPSSASLRLRSVGARSSLMAVSQRFVIVR